MKLVLGAVLVAAAAAVIEHLPDLAKYFEIREM